MTLQVLPIVEGQIGDGPTLYDRRFLGPANTTRPTFRLREALDGVTLNLRIAWLQTADMWVMGVRSDSGAVVACDGAVPLTASGVDLWAPLRSDSRMPGGQLWIAWGDQRPRAPGRDDWRGEASLYYRPSELVAAVEGTALELF